MVGGTGRDDDVEHLGIKALGAFFTMNRLRECGSLQMNKPVDDIGNVGVVAHGRVKVVLIRSSDLLIDSTGIPRVMSLTRDDRFAR